ncbi:hypothetical protein [Nonomuraea gerenzanensis]|uniref:Uncharacterized protein n=1 Tax=Nonomuraea gerenzanensis TaxID=93944 RepID=A0A1M4EL70_9ACTN|nr:hypothetical protein [Nonomuraea gerenzanensis]UBU11122.1 hypothetical protein LCN96_43485 [Nonomuraea gerenzanensis]SBO99586.1 hypothetical protein BN4615_P9102 [Nonomuraea gerenzanensis]
MTARRTATTTISSLALALALATTPSTPAHAATGTFAYTYPTPNGTGIADLTDPSSGTCINLPEVYATEDSAHTPINHTDSTVTMFTGLDCTGDYYSLRPGGRASNRLLLKSVVFS